MVYVAPICSKHKNESLFQNLAKNIVKVQTLGGIVLLGGDFNATLATFVNYYGRLSLLKLSNQVLWLNDRIMTPLLAIGAVSS